MKALVIDEPWIGLILRGEKTWEMRKTANHDRGLVGLVRKGSGLVVGVADLVDSKPPIRPEDYPATERFHAIPGEAQRWAIDAGYLVPWVLTGARALPHPVAYRHKPGSQSRIILGDDVAKQVRQQLDYAAFPPSPSTRTNGAMTSSLSQPPRKQAASRVQNKGRIEGDVAYVPLSESNINNSHFSLRQILDLFPEQAVGGSDATQKAKLLLTVQYRPGNTIQTDITGPNRTSLEKRSNHCFFRERAPIRDFFARSGAKAGDTVVIRRDAPGSYTVTLERTPDA